MNQLYTMTITYTVGEYRYDVVINDITLSEMRCYQELLKTSADFLQFRNTFFNKRHIVTIKFQEQPVNPLTKLEE